MKVKLIGILSKHPSEVGMSYFQHGKFALRLSLRFLKAAFCSLIHAFFPFLFTNYASVTVQDLYNILNKRIDSRHED